LSWTTHSCPAFAIGSPAGGGRCRFDPRRRCSFGLLSLAVCAQPSLGPVGFAGCHRCVVPLGYGFGTCCCGPNGAGRRGSPLGIRRGHRGGSHVGTRDGNHGGSRDDSPPGPTIHRTRVCPRQCAASQSSHQTRTPNRSTDCSGRGNRRLPDGDSSSGDTRGDTTSRSPRPRIPHRHRNHSRPACSRHKRHLGVAGTQESTEALLETTLDVTCGDRGCSRPVRVGGPNVASLVLDTDRISYYINNTIIRYFQLMYF
jgi:hypothetical protein